MGWGVVNKCAMYWNKEEDMIWPEDEFWFNLLSSEKTKWTYFFNPSSFKRTPTLTAWIGGRDAIEMETQTDEQIMNKYIMKNLASMFPGIRRPDKVVITRWNQEENILGTYSYKTVGRNFTEDTNKLKKSIGRIWFAGEATSSNWFGTTIGKK